MGEQAPPNQPTGKTGDERPTWPGWDVTFHPDGQDGVVVRRLGVAPALGRYPAADGLREGAILRVVCSACGRSAHGFRVGHDPRRCYDTHSDAGSYRGFRATAQGVAKVLPRDKRTRAYKDTRRQVGLL